MDQIQFEDVINSEDIENQSGGYGNGKLVPEDSKFVQDFYAEVANVKNLIKRIEENIELLEKDYKKIEIATQNDKKLKGM